MWKKLIRLCILCIAAAGFTQPFGWLFQFQNSVGDLELLSVSVLNWWFFVIADFSELFLPQQTGTVHHPAWFQRNDTSCNPSEGSKPHFSCCILTGKCVYVVDVLKCLCVPSLPGIWNQHCVTLQWSLSSRSQELSDVDQQDRRTRSGFCCKNI